MTDFGLGDDIVDEEKRLEALRWHGFLTLKERCKMSTRATYQFVDKHTDVTIYKHHDGYPEGGYQWIARSTKLAWPLPRFEADDFAAAFIAANKDSGGGVRFGGYTRDDFGDTEYHYVVRCNDGKIAVEMWEPDGWGDDRKWAKTEEGTLDEMLDKHAPDRQWVGKATA